MRTYIYSIIAFILFGMSSCVDRTFDEPNFLFEDPDLEVTQSIAALKSTHVDGQYEVLSGGNVISGVVVANDKSGNFYETIVISDDTGGIEVKLGKRSLFNTFPVGRNVFIKTDGLLSRIKKSSNILSHSGYIRQKKLRLCYTKQGFFRLLSTEI